jgi:DNA-binding PadR family transcriptional regulator
VDRHTAAIAKTIEFNSDDVLQVEQGSLCPALHRLIERRWISVEEGMSENNRRAKFYCLTAEGRKQLKAETSKRDKTGGGDRANSPPRRVKSCFAKGLGLWRQESLQRLKARFL